MVSMSLAPGCIPAGERVYAVGDVHGCATRLATLHALIRQHLADHPVPRPTIVHLGDYIDRGENSADVLARLRGGCWPDPQPRLVNLMGNHEAMFLEAFDSRHRDSARHWLENGGADSLLSWGISPSADPAEWHEHIPAGQVAFLRSLSTCHHQGGYVFVHAGLRPGIPMAAQTVEDMLWIREPFLSFRGELPAVVVHGHTPERSPLVRPNRIGIDTGAVMGGMLTAAVLEADRIGFLHA